MNLDFCPNCFAPLQGTICPNCNFNVGTMEITSFELKPATVLGGRYKIGRVLGIGGFGITYVGVDLQTGERYAIKEYMPRDIALRHSNGRIEPASPDVKPDYDKGLELFLYETNILITLSGSPGIVEAKNFITENNTGYLIMEYVDGISAKKLLNSRGVIDPEFALDILQQVAVALKYVHAKGLLHRDISPENIMIMKNSTIRLIDFGASRFFLGERSRSLSLILKHGFAPPEQYSSSSNQGEWTDIYALAATYYKMVTGITLPEALERFNNDTVERLDRINPAVKPHIASAIQKALALNYRDRYKNVDQFLKALKYQGGFAPQKRESSVSQNITENPPQMAAIPPNLVTNPQAAVAPQPAYVAPPVSIQVPFIRVIHGAGSIGVWHLNDEREVFIGRDSASCSIALPFDLISRKHCSIRYDRLNEKFIITDYSSNGVFLSNGMRLDRGIGHFLNKSDVVMLASPEIIVEVGIQNGK